LIFFFKATSRTKNFFDRCNGGQTTFKSSPALVMVPLYHSKDGVFLGNIYILIMIEVKNDH